MKKLKLTSLTLPPSPVTLVAAENAGTTSETGGEKPLPRFTLTAYTGGKAQPKDFPCPVVVDLQGIDIPQQKSPVRFEHKSFQGVGHTEKIAIVSTDVQAEGIISRDTSWARDVALSAKNGFPWQASMGGPIHETEYIPFGQKVTVNGQTFEGELYVIRNMTLKEISFVDLAADPNTSAKVEFMYEERLETRDSRLEGKIPNQPSSEKTRIEMKSNENTDSLEVMISGMQSKISALESRATSLEPLIIDQRRIAAIEKIGGGKYPELEAKAIEEGWAVEKFHSEYQAKTMPEASKISVSGTQSQRGGLKPTALEAIALSTSGCSQKFLEAQYDEQSLDQVDRYRGIGIQEFCELACGAKYLPKYRRDSRGWLEAAFSSASLPGILSNVANKVLLEGFLSMDDTWKKIVKIASVNNFQTHQRYRMNGAFKFEKVGPDGEIKHGSIGEQAFSQQVDTFGVMFALTRQMIINDDLGAFNDIPRGIGVGAAEAISDAVWECVLANSVQKDGKKFFSTEHKNYLNTADVKLDVDGLTKAELAFSEQERMSGRPLGIPASILLVPAALKVAAEMLMKSMTLNETTTPDKAKPATNPHAGKYETVSSPHLGSKVFKGNSATAWYLLADPRRLAAYEVAFLGGQERPTVERADADFNILGIQFRGFIDFGVKEQDHRGALKLDPAT